MLIVQPKCFFVCESESATINLALHENSCSNWYGHRKRLEFPERRSRVLSRASIFSHWAGDCVEETESAPDGIGHACVVAIGVGRHPFLLVSARHVLPASRRVADHINRHGSSRPSSPGVCAEAVPTGSRCVPSRFPWFSIGVPSTFFVLQLWCRPIRFGSCEWHLSLSRTALFHYRSFSCGRKNWL